MRRAPVAPIGCRRNPNGTGKQHVLQVRTLPVFHEILAIVLYRMPCLRYARECAARADLPLSVFIPALGTISSTLEATARSSSRTASALHSTASPQRDAARHPPWLGAAPCCGDPASHP